MNTDPNIVCSIKSCNFRTFHAGAQGLRKLHSFQGQSNEIFDPHLFTPFEPAWATDQRVSSSYSNFSESPLGIIHCAESISTQYYTAGSHVTFRILFKRTFQQDFLLPTFFHHSNLGHSLTSGLKLF